jgi:hypothetical protein
MHRFFTYRALSVHDKFVSSLPSATQCCDLSRCLTVFSLSTFSLAQIVSTACVHVAGKVEETPKRITGDQAQQALTALFAAQCLTFSLLSLSLLFVVCRDFADGVCHVVRRSEPARAQEQSTANRQ